MKLLKSNKSKITKNENGKNGLHLEINQVVLVHCNNIKNHCQKDSRVLYTVIPDKSFGQLLDIWAKTLYF